VTPRGVEKVPSLARDLNPSFKIPKDLASRYNPCAEMKWDYWKRYEPDLRLRPCSSRAAAAQNALPIRYEKLAVHPSRRSRWEPGGLPPLRVQERRSPTGCEKTVYVQGRVTAGSSVVLRSTIPQAVFQGLGRYWLLSLSHKY
jgi:hypothetical protein